MAVMMPDRVRTISDKDSLTIRINGPMDLLLTAAPRGSYCDAGRAYRHNVVDCREVSTVRDSGLALLLMLKRWTSLDGARLYVINGSSDPMCRYHLLGIQTV
jgi:hypothetical protein